MRHPFSLKIKNNCSANLKMYVIVYNKQVSVVYYCIEFEKNNNAQPGPGPRVVFKMLITRSQIKGTLWILLLLRLKNFILVNRNLW